MDVRLRPVLGIDGRVALVRDAARRLAGVHVHYEHCAPGGARVRQLAEGVRREFRLGEDGALPYVTWSDGSVVHLEARREGTCTLTVAGPAFSEAFVTALLGPVAAQRQTAAGATYPPNMVQAITQICERLHRGANARTVVIVDDGGHVIGQAGDTSLLPATAVSSRKDPQANASAPIGSFHEAAAGTLYILSGPPFTIGVLFDDSSSPGLVRLRVREATAALATLQPGSPRN